MNNDTVRDTFRDCGYVIRERLLDGTAVRALRGAMDRVTADPAAVPPHLREKLLFEREHVANFPDRYQRTMTPEQCGGSIRLIHDVGLFDPVFVRLIRHDGLLDVLETLFQSTEFSFYLMYARPVAPFVGNGVVYHRDTPFKSLTAANLIVSLLYLDDTTPDNATVVVAGSHKVSDVEAGRPCWKDVPVESIGGQEQFVCSCRAGDVLFMDGKAVHAAGHNRSGSPRRTLILEWVGPDVLPADAIRHAYQGLRPRSRLETYARQMALTFARIEALESGAP